MDKRVIVNVKNKDLISSALHTRVVHDKLGFAQLAELSVMPVPCQQLNLYHSNKSTSELRGTSGKCSFSK